jgi:hypothetical protein
MDVDDNVKFCACMAELVSRTSKRGASGGWRIAYRPNQTVAAQEHEIADERERDNPGFVQAYGSEVG